MSRSALGVLIVMAAVGILTAPFSASGAELAAAAVDQAPILDGVGDEGAWALAEGVTVKDNRTGDDVTLKAVTSGDMIYFLVSFPDKEEDVLHKPWVWNEDMKVYELGAQREDGFTFKWSMSGNSVDLSNFADNDFKADVWYWKASRTNPAGYADDKHHILSSESGKKAKAVKTTGGGTRYLMRIGDKGKGAQKKQIVTEYTDDVVPQYVPQEPDGSRADVLAKGLWKDGAWTIEFARKLATGHDDDIQFEAGTGKRYLFGISIFGLYANDIDDGKAHFYGQGRISEALTLLIP